MRLIVASHIFRWCWKKNVGSVITSAWVGSLFVEGTTSIIHTTRPKVRPLSGWLPWSRHQSTVVIVLPLESVTVAGVVGQVQWNSEATSLMALAKWSFFFSQKLLIDSRFWRHKGGGADWLYQSLDHNSFKRCTESSPCIIVTIGSELRKTNFLHTSGPDRYTSLVSRYPPFWKGTTRCGRRSSRLDVRNSPIIQNFSLIRRKKCAHGRIPDILDHFATRFEPSP